LPDTIWPFTDEKKTRKGGGKKLFCSNRLHSI